MTDQQRSEAVSADMSETKQWKCSYCYSQFTAGGFGDIRCPNCGDAYITEVSANGDRSDARTKTTLELTGKPTEEPTRQRFDKPQQPTEEDLWNEVGHWQQELQVAQAAIRDQSAAIAERDSTIAKSKIRANLDRLDIEFFQLTIAERDATIAELRAGQDFYMRQGIEQIEMASEAREQIAALQARVAELEEQKSLALRTVEFYQTHLTPTTEK